MVKANGGREAVGLDIVAEELRAAEAIIHLLGSEVGGGGGHVEELGGGVVGLAALILGEFLGERERVVEDADGRLHVLTSGHALGLTCKKRQKLPGASALSGLMAGAFSEVIVGLAGTATAVVLFPVLKRQSESAAL